MKFTSGKVSEALGSAYDASDRTTVDTGARDYVYDEVERFNDDFYQKDLDEAVGRMKQRTTKKVPTHSVI